VGYQYSQTTLSLSHTHSCTHIHAHTFMHTHTNTHTHPCSESRIFGPWLMTTLTLLQVCLLPGVSIIELFCHWSSRQIYYWLSLVHLCILVQSLLSRSESSVLSGVIVHCHKGKFNVVLTKHQSFVSITSIVFPISDWPAKYCDDTYLDNTGTNITGATWYIGNAKHYKAI
jgi:hypothetical protein